MNKKITACAFAILLLSVGAVRADTTISTYGSFGSATEFTCLGQGDSCLDVFGQSFTVPLLDPHLQSFKLRFSPTGGMFVQSKIYQWNGSDTVSPALYTSPVTALPIDNIQDLTFSPNVLLVPGAEYLFAVDTSGIGNPDGDTTGWFGVDGTTYPGGVFVTQTVSGVSAFNVASPDVWGDSIFEAQFTAGVAAIPEPSTYALMLAGLGFVGFVANRRRKINATA